MPTLSHQLRAGGAKDLDLCVFCCTEQPRLLHLGDSLLSFCPRLVMNGHHRTDGKWSRDKDQNGGKWAFPFVQWWLLHHMPTINRVSPKEVKSEPCFFTKTVRFGREKLSLFFLESSSRVLQPGHGFRACSFKSERKHLDFHMFGVKKRKKLKQMKNSVKCWSPEL